MNKLQLRNYLKQDRNYKTKVDAIKKHCTKDQLQKWNIKVAESVLYIYEDECPGDTRVRDCIQASKDYLVGKINIRELEKAANAAHAAAYAAANATAYAAYAAASAAYNASYATQAVTNRQDQEELNIQLMIETLEIRIPDTKIARKLYKDEIIREEDNYIII